MILITFCYCNSISSRIFQGEKYPPLAKMLELEQEKSQFNDSMEYLKALKYICSIRKELIKKQNISIEAL